MKQQEEEIEMVRENLISRNPLRLLGFETDNVLPPGGFGAVCARAGVGKTALLVQLALNTLLREQNVLHISLSDPVDKISLWYQEVYNNLVIDHDSQQTDALFQRLLPYRFIMNFRAEGFSIPKLEERLMDLVSQNIFTPRMAIIDGFAFDESARQSLEDLKKMAGKQAIHIWFTLRTHRHEAPEGDRLPPPLSRFEDLFDIALQLRPEAKEIHVECVKGTPPVGNRGPLLLDPSTMLARC